MPGNADFQSVALQEHFEVQSDELVQSLHNSHGSWLTISTVGVTQSEVSVYDSMCPTTSIHTKHQIVSLLATSQRRSD